MWLSQVWALPEQVIQQDSQPDGVQLQGQRRAGGGQHLHGGAGLLVATTVRNLAMLLGLA